MNSMHDYLEAYLRFKEAMPLTILRWNEAWLHAVEHPGTPLPCPECFMQGRIARLVPRPNIGDKARAGCKTCGNTFEWPDEG